MKNILKSTFFAFLFTFALIGCSSEEATEEELGTVTPVDETATIRITEGGADDDKYTAEINGAAGGIVEGRVVFNTAGTDQRRLYITQTLPGESAAPFEIPTLTNKSTKADGSIDLDGGAKDGFDYTFDLNVPNDVNGSIIYNFWSTTGKGDFRDATKRKLLGVGSIEVKVGTGTTTDSDVRSFTGIKLFAPAQDGSTTSFFSLLNGESYKINVGPEYRFFWDFGYYYGASGVAIDDNASFSSTSYYGTAFPFTVTGLADTSDADETLNNMYFSDPTTNTAGFDNVTMSSDLDYITGLTNQNVTNLEQNSVVEFIDNYGKKGLIKVTQVEGEFNNDDFITFDVKIQR